MAIYIYNGLPGSGKSTKLASIALDLLEQNKRLFLKMASYGKPRRLVVSNMKFSKEIEKKYGYGTHESYIEYWDNLTDLIEYRHVDVIIDEVATYLDSTQWKEVPLSVKRWLQQHRHFGLDIFGSTQDFKTIDISMRRLVKKAWWVRKVIGSRDISTTLPDVKNPWGLVWLNEIPWEDFTNDAQDYKLSLFPEWLFITKKRTSCFDTTQDILGSEYPALIHKVKYCKTCGFEKVSHT